MNKTVKNIIDSVWGALSQRPCYKHSYPDNVTDTQFAVVNTLGMPIDPIQTVEVNVNIYAKDINPQAGVPNLTLLDSLTASAIADVSGYHGTGNNIIHLSLVTSILLRETDLQMHLTNNRFQAIYLNN
jgi:hypothetical protein